MKHPLLFLVMIAISALCFAGIDDFYSFTTGTETYQPITGTPIASIAYDDALSEAIALGFSFPYGENSYTQVMVSSNGWVGLGSTFTHSNLTNQLNSASWAPVLAPLWDDISLSGGSCQYLLSGTAPNRVFTIEYNNLKWNYSATNQFNLQVRIKETGHVEFIYGSATGTPSNASASIGINMLPGGVNWFYSVTPGAVPSVSMASENTMINTFPASGTKYMFSPTPPAANDMAAVALAGNLTPSVGSAIQYTVSVRNRGSNPQSVYQVKLVTSTGTELASVAGTAIQPNQVLDFPITWTPTTEGPLIIRGKVVLTGDENPANDLSPALNITVMPAGMVVMTIGTGDQQALIPVNMWWMNSLFETLYYPTEIGMVGNISAISFYNNFVTNLPNMPTKIWLGSTQNADLSAGWIPSTQLTQVFDGTVNYPSGANTITIPLQTVFTYTGGNLVMMVQRPMDTQYYNSSDVFYCQTVGTNRSRIVYSDGTPYDPANPPADVTVNGQFPKTSLHMSPLGTDPIAIINPTTINYGQVLMNTTHTRQVSIMNGGGGTMNVSQVALAGSPYFQITNPPTLPANLTTGQSIVLNLNYNPLAAGGHTGTITITDNTTRQVHTVQISGSCIDPTIYALPYAQNFDTVTAPSLPLDWSKIQQGTGAIVQTSNTQSFNQPNSVYMYNSSDNAANLLLIAPPYANNVPVTGSWVHFWARGSSASSSLKVGVMTNPQDAASFTEIQSLALSTTWTEYVVSLAGYTGTGRSVAFKHGNALLYDGVYIDNVFLEVIPQNDLAALSVAGNQTPSVGNATQYTATIYNWGSNAQATYTVKLYNAANVELATSAGVNVAPAQTASVPIMWTPTTEGPNQIYAKVFLAGDQNPLNDASPMLSLTVQPAGTMVVTIGSGDQLGRIPVDMYYRNSLFETLFYPQEIGMFGTITSLSFYNDFVTNLPNMPTKVWLGSTQNNDLTGGWIPSTNLTLVYDGTINYPSGQNTITIPLQTPFTYVGGNLVMMVNRPMDTTYYSSMDRFQSQTLTQMRALNVFSDGTEYSPTAPPPATASGAFPKTSIHMTPLGTDPVFMIYPESRNYGTVLLNSTHDQEFRVMNAGGGTLSVTSVQIAGSPHFSLVNVPALPVDLNTGASFTFLGRYNPTAVGTHTATITVNDNIPVVMGSRDATRNRMPHNVALSGTCVDPTIMELPYLQNFDAVTAPALPVQWTRITSSTSASVTTTTTTPYSAPNSVVMTNGSDANATVLLVAPPYANTIATNTTRVKFYARSASANFTLAVGVMTDPQIAATFTEMQSINLSTTWTEYVVSLGGYTGTGRVVAFKHGLGGTSRSIFIDNVMLEVIPQNDLAAIAIQGNTTPSVGSPTNYVVSIYNWGSNPQNTYQVKLFTQGDIEVGSVAGPAINPGQTVQVSVPWTPSTQGPTFVYGKVVLTGDQNNLNDQSPNFLVTVQPQGLVVLTVGDGNQTGRIPVDMYYMNSLYECMYYPAELSNTLGIIYGIGFYNNFSTNLMNKPTKVWMGTTTQADLSAGWIPSTQLTLVFDGTVNYPSGSNLINISFATPFLYLDGGNLVVMVQRPMDSQYFSSSDVFQTQTGTQMRARNAFSDGTAYDPTNPPTASASAIFPKTSFFIIPGGVGHLNGTILGVGNQPLPGVAISSSPGNYTATTNVQGQFSIQNIVADNYQFTFSHHGYITRTDPITIPEDETITHNITMQQMPVVTVSGTIVASDTGVGLPGAGIFLQGYENYSANSNTQGQFTFPSVYANFTYDYTIICPGYQNASGSINVTGANYNFGNIILSEVAYAPRQVSGEIINNNTQVSLNWQAPDPNALDITESFEDETFPPEGWTRTITNNGPANTNGVYPTWCRFGPITISGQPATPHEGMNQAGLWWSYEHQDEWLITPAFNCPPAAYLRFWSYVFLGSTNGDHYYVKISLDDGNNWTTLWDASAQTGGWNYYEYPISIDLAMYEGLQIKLAWNAVDPPSNDGLWYVWFIDDIYVGNEVTSISFLPSTLNRSSAAGAHFTTGIDYNLPTRAAKSELSMSQNSNPGLSATTGIQNPRNNTRALVGYKVWRLITGQENNPSSWTLVTPQTITELSCLDTGWGSIPNGSYRWAVRAVYTADVMSVPAFSNMLIKEVVSGYISGVVRTVQNAPIPAATVTAGTYTATTNNSGAYSIIVPIGTYSVTASKTGYVSQTVENVLVNANQTTTVNFNLQVGSANDDDVIPVTQTALHGNYPNPFNPETTIAYDIKDAGAVRLNIYNIKGQVVRTLVDATLAGGRYSVVWNGRDSKGKPVSSGVYYYRLECENFVSTRKMILMQ